jgi:Zn-dependent protease with chaperone function
MLTWYGAMLFAIVPLRNILPGSPPYGSWIDQAVVLWVLIGLVVAMSLYALAWWRQRDRKPKKG